MRNFAKNAGFVLLIGALVFGWLYQAADTILNTSWVYYAVIGSVILLSVVINVSRMTLARMRARKM